jgi:hypothetical protein
MGPKPAFSTIRWQSKCRPLRLLLTWCGGWGKSILNQIITVDKSAVSMKKLEAKQHPKQWLEIGVPGPVMAKAHGTRTKTMVLTFLTARESCTTTMSPRAKLSTLSAYSKCYKSSRGS